MQIVVELALIQPAAVLQWASTAAEGGYGQAACRRLAGYALRHSLACRVVVGLTFATCPNRG